MTDATDQRTIHQLVTLCGDLQSDLASLRAQVAVLANAVALNGFTIEAPAADTCESCNGSGKWTDNIGQDHFCWSCKGTGKVQS